MIVTHSKQIFTRLNPQKHLQIFDIRRPEKVWTITGLSLFLWKNIDGKRNWEQIIALSFQQAKSKISREDFEILGEELLHDLLKHKFVTPVLKK